MVINLLTVGVSTSVAQFGVIELVNVFVVALSFPSSPVPLSSPVFLVSARRLDVYEDQSELVGCSTTLRSRCSRKSLSCRSLSCNQSSLSLNTLGAESDDDDDDEQLPSPVQARTSAFSSRVVRLSLLLGNFCPKDCLGLVFPKCSIAVKPKLVLMKKLFFLF